MRICVIANARSIHTRRWVRAYAERGHETHVLSIHDADLPGVRVHAVGRPAAGHRSVPATALAYLALLLSVRRLLRRVDPDVVHAHYTVTHGVIAALSGFHPRVVSAWGRDVIWDDGPMPWPLRRLNRLALRRPDAISATSHFLARHVERFAPRGRQVTVIPFGIEAERFRPRRRSDDGVFRLGFLKALHRKYGPDVLLRALPEVARAVPSVHLVMAGRGPMEGELRRLIDELGLAERVELPGHVSHDRVPELMAGFDVFVHPSVYPSESFGVAVLEASACAVPVVATRVGGVPEVCLDGETGLMVPPRDPRALAAALVRLARDRELRGALGRGGRELVLRRYRWADNVERMITLLREQVDAAR